MTTYDFMIEMKEGDIESWSAEFTNNEDAKRHLKAKMKEFDIPKGKYVFVRIIRKDEKEDKEIINDLWCVN